MQPGAHDADRVVVAGEDQPPVLAELVALGGLQRRGSRSEVGDVRGDLAEVPLRLGARLEQPLRQHVGLLLDFPSGILVDAVGVFQRFLL